MMMLPREFWFGPRFDMEVPFVVIERSVPFPLRLSKEFVLTVMMPAPPPRAVVAPEFKVPLFTTPLVIVSPPVMVELLPVSVRVLGPFLVKSVLLVMSPEMRMSP